jgi:2'-5' RNA ligase
MTQPPLEGRLFLAVPLTDAVRTGLATHLARACGPAGVPGRRVADKKWHLTLRVLGDCDAQTGARLHALLRLAEKHGTLGKPFAVTFGRLGAFPSPERARVLWLGTTPDSGALKALAASVARVVAEAGFPRDEKPFAAHLTLSRLEGIDVRRLLAQAPAFEAALPVTEIVLFRSSLGNGPPRYAPLARYALSAPAAGTG